VAGEQIIFKEGREEVPYEEGTLQDIRQAFNYEEGLYQRRHRQFQDLSRMFLPWLVTT
jgi:hypothetical protein